MATTKLTEKEMDLIQQCAKVKELKLKLETLKEELEQAEGRIKEELVAQGLSEIKVGLFKITYKDCSRTSFDKESFKEDYADLYEKYVSQTTYKRLMIK